MQIKGNINNCVVIELPKIINRAGSITIVNGGNEVFFQIERVYYLYDVPGGVARGGHAHRELHQLIVAASGSFDVIIDDAKNKKIISLNKPNFGLLLTPGIWRELENFSSGAICLVLASTKYNEADYIRDYNDFVIWNGGNQ